MSFARPTGSRFAFFAALPFVLFGILAFSLPAPEPPGGLPLSGLLGLDGVLVLFLVVLWPYHRGGRLAAGMAAVWLAALLAWLLATGVAEFPSAVAFRKLLLGPVVVGSLAYACGAFALRARPPWRLARDWHRNRVRAREEARAHAARKQARATWTRFLELRPEARVARVQVRLRGSDGDGSEMPVCRSDGEHEFEFQRTVKTILIWGTVLDAGPETVRIQLRSRDGSLVVGTCEAHLRRVYDWELVMRDGAIEGGWSLRAFGEFPSRLGIRPPKRVLRRLRRCRPLPIPASGTPAR